MSKNSTKSAKKGTKNEKKKGVNFFFVLVEFVLCSFLIASISMKMILPGILSAFLAVFITSFPDTGCGSSQAEGCDAVDRVGEQYGDRNRISL